ncbi:condensin complex subunit SMC2 [Phanerochaete sordida]|uniref:Structural maintenance of chromosomes protein n=1 Tax=Phanerochaete sordida TaxID=48140 RepID=A0A9P3LGY7_9APHY|nr:condensin complex subunit SMC2 [Phanerochaete sordida]
MRISELIIDGFKSYPERTIISGWDPSFNAITGLNGSGKSNILDAICFVLGITNMSAMRAQNQVDLIYKRGQAGVTKASVTIVFDNTDRASSPVGFENQQTITVTRQIALPNISKYLLNGHKTEQHRVQTVFQSVQLNINNPNFLIMQGRITKVLNMRPQEILGMIEEASGTRMYEERKDKAKKTMGKKDKRVQELTSLLADEITPKLDRLREEKRAYLQWQKAIQELERVGRVLRAWEWTDFNQRAEKKEQEIANAQNNAKKLGKLQERLQKEIEANDKEVAKVVKQRDAELQKGGKFKKLEEAVSELGKTLVKTKTQIDIKTSSIADEEGKVQALVDALAEAEQALKEKRKQVSEFELSHGAVKDKHATLQAALTNAEELLQTLLTGLSSSNTGQSGGGYMGQLADARARQAQSSAEEEQSRVKLASAEKDLKALQARSKDLERESSEGKRNLAAMKTEVEKVRQKLERTGWSAQKEAEGEVTLRNARNEVRELTERRDAIKQRLTFLDFSYSDPRPGFDRSQVKGLVASLISLAPAEHDKSTALEIAAGGRLYNVVVDNERVGKDLLQNGRLKKRVTIIPLNKINAHKMSSQKIAAVNRLAGDKAHVALSLIGYPEEVANAMNFVFGETLICDDAASAKLVTFSREIGVKSVTIDGDVYDPSGTLSGGAAPSGSGILVRVQGLLDAERALGEAVGRLRELEREEQRTRQGREQWRQLNKEVELKEHELALLEQQVAGSNSARLEADVETAKQRIGELKNALTNAQDRQKQAKEDIKRLERDMDEFKNNKEGKIEELKKDIQKKKAELQKHAVLVKTQQKDLQTAVLELEQLEKDLETDQEGLEEAKAGIGKLRKELDHLNKKYQAQEAEFQEAETRLNEERATLSRYDNELKDLEATIKTKKQAISDTELQLKQIEHDITNAQKERTGLLNSIAGLEKQNDWIESEKSLFGRPGTAYDFRDVDAHSLREKTRELEGQQKSMKKKVNPKAMAMIDSVEKQESTLKKKLTQVLGDREKIEKTIEELDKFKYTALENTWTKVTKDFGEIFAELLPGNTAKLQPPEGMDLTQGLEVKVRLGSVWKQSLTELSGGQRSLIALSLIMSLLQYKPAPMYILDEIDAALDLSHTQHIGQLFRNRFKGSQFIVVSLKEGLFTNANVLFRTRFRDGTSIVERTEHRSTSALYHDREGQENERPRARRREA